MNSKTAAAPQSEPVASQTYTCTFGHYKQTTPWTDARTFDWQTLAKLLVTHEVGRKEGDCIVPAVFSGGRRQKAHAHCIDVAFLDSDAGATLDEIATAIRARGWSAVVSSTHSHLVNRTTVARTSWERFAGDQQDREAAFLVRQKGFTQAIAAGARIVEEVAESVSFEHQPCPKFRVVLPLLRPWRAADHATQVVANAAWKERVEALAWALALDHDQACTDTSRLFFLPRTPPGGAAPETLVIDGSLCDLFALPGRPILGRVGRRCADRQSGLGVDAARSTADAPGTDDDILPFADRETGEVLDLLDWVRTYGPRFKIATALRARRPAVLTGHVANRTKVHLRCVNAEAHSQISSDAATFVIDAGSSENGSFVYHCRHSHCDGRDRLFFLRRMLEDGWLTVADLTDSAFLLDDPSTADAGEDTNSSSAEKSTKPTSGGPAWRLLTEHTVAAEFSSRHAERLRYCHDTGSWFHWNGTMWQQNRTKLAFDWARRLADELNTGRDVRTRTTTGKAAFAAAVERFAQADAAMACTMDLWNVEPFLLGTPTGTVDLRTGELRRAVPSDYITKTTAVGPAASPECPLWLSFLAQSTGGDLGLIDFLRQWCGYMLTGDTREHALLFIYGPGGNGKSVFLNTIMGVLGDYCRAAPLDTFAATQGDRHPTDLAMLHGARLVCASETEEGRAWAESRIKQMTGGDKVAARFMRQDFFEYIPQFKLAFAGNHKPTLRNVDDAARRRFNIVPFIRKPETPDRQLEAKLSAEWPAILRWMIEGCLDWQMNGLVRPDVVRDATADYFEAQDTFGRWVSERCVLDSSLTSKPGVLAADCRKWTEANGEMLISPSQFRSAMEKVSGIRYAKVRGVHCVKGVGLQVAPPRQGEGGEGGGG